MNGQQQLRARHAKRITQLQEFHFSLHHKSGKNNRVADALSHKHAMLSSMKVDVMDFELIRDLLPSNPYFGPILAYIARDEASHYTFHDGTCFWEIICAFLVVLYVISLLRKCTIGCDKTLSSLRKRFFWPSIDYFSLCETMSCLLD